MVGGGETYIAALLTARFRVSNGEALIIQHAH